MPYIQSAGLRILLHSKCRVEDCVKFRVQGSVLMCIHHRPVYNFPHPPYPALSPNFFPPQCKSAPLFLPDLSPPPWPVHCACLPHKREVLYLTAGCRCWLQEMMGACGWKVHAPPRPLLLLLLCCRDAGRVVCATGREAEAAAS